MIAPPTTARAGFLRQVLLGAGFLGRGFGLWVSSPRLMFLGAVPALMVGALYIVIILVLFSNLGPLATAAIPFAEAWTEPWQTAARWTVGLALAGVGFLVLAYSYVALTLAVGDPFYERIWRAVEVRLGNPPPERSESVGSAMLRSFREGIRLLLTASGLGLVLLLCGLIPVVGQILALALGALFGGWLLTIELTGLAFDARGFSLRERRRLLARRRATSLGFGLCTYLLFLIPFAAIAVMPAAVAGAAMLSRDALAAQPLAGGRTADER